MSLLSQAFRAQVKQTKDYSQKNEMTYSVSYPTGFLNLDFANGYIQEVNGKLLYEIGITDGSINMYYTASGFRVTFTGTKMAAQFDTKDWNLGPGYIVVLVDGELYNNV